MNISITRARDNGALSARMFGACALALAIACLVTTAPLHAEESHRGDQRRGQGHAAPHASYRHDDHRRDGYGYGNRDYGYGAPPVVYAPQEAPGINLFLPL